MLTENDARRLLAQAAATVEVGPAAPVEPVRRRTWPVLAAALALLVAGVGVWAGVAGDDTDGAPDPAVDPGVLEPGVVPSVFGYRRAAATQILTDAGLDVRVVERPACDSEGQAIGTLPSTGVRMEPGSVVTLQVAAQGISMDCSGVLTAPWQLLGLATREVQSPALLNGRLTAYLDGERRTVRDASDPDAWGSPSALDALRAAVEWSPDVPRTWRTLEQQEPGCDGEAFVPPVGSGTTLQRYAIEFDAPDVPCAQLTVAGEFGKRPLAVAVETSGLELPTAPTPSPGVGAVTVPAVFGLREQEARDLMYRAGLTTISVEAEPGCFEPGRALEAEPAAGTLLDPTSPVVLAVSGPQDGTCYPLGGSDPSLAALWALVDFARGGRPPAFADAVTTAVDGQLSTEKDPGTLRSWSSGSPLEVLAAVAGDARPDLTGGRLLRSGWDGPFPPECNVDGVTPGELPPVLDTPFATRAWFGYERDGDVRACLLVDISVDEEDGIDGLGVRSVDPDGILPDPVTEQASTEVNDVVTSLLAFAQGQLTEPMFLADEVRLYDAGRYVRTVPSPELGDPLAWLVCDTGGSDQCIGSALEALAYSVGDLPTATADAETISRALPPGTATVVSVGPPDVTGCQPRGIVALFLDDEELVLGVDVTKAPDGPCDEEGLAPPE